MISITALFLVTVFSFDTNQACEDTEPFCIMETQIPVEVLAERLDGLDETYWIDDNTITIAGHRDADSVFLCCAIQAPMRQAEDSKYWYLSVTVPRLDEAFIDVFPIPFNEPSRLTRFQPLEFRGNNALPPVSRYPVTDDDIEERTIDSVSLGVPRRFSIYLPPELEESTSRPVLYMADGQSTVSYAQIVQSLINECRIEPLMLVGLWHGAASDGLTPQQVNDQRSHDYLWGREGNHFEAHEAFFLNEVMPIVEAEYQARSDPGRRVLFGKSSGAAWALSTGLRNPAEFGAVGAVSTVWGQSPDAALPQSGPRYYLSAGLFEDRAPPLMADIAERFIDAGVDFQQRTFVSGHSPLVGYQAFEDILLSEFPIEDGRQCQSAE